ncbi:invasion associated locus B family protein [Pseudovibrio sp. POLY-S9]|uniref:invasion associated locus B family protein n=1 Tax=Pseudovibrio sp. POLY-S9 TaxID=1576596 RepID=UPI00070CFBD1
MVMGLFGSAYKFARRVRVHTLVFLACSLVITPGFVQDATAGASFWQTKCEGVSREASGLRCVAVQTISLKKSKKLLFKFEVVAPPSNRKPYLLIQGPLGIHLSAGWQLFLDEKLQETLPINTCDARGCFSSKQFNADLLRSWSKGSKLMIKFAPSPGKEQIVDIPLQGFGKALNAIR